ncbi:MAG: hypothetical protein MUF52_10860, partial [Syntrophobacteraceae bacterium]|nr:hypothetical protein [Syntrophobacteraceae bacterium]
MPPPRCRHVERFDALLQCRSVFPTATSGSAARVLPAEVGKYVKKWGAKVGKTTVPTGSDKNEGVLDVHSVDVTEAMVDSVMQGQPLFSKTAEGQGAKTDQHH